jgi:hypothetical protein
MNVLMTRESRAGRWLLWGGALVMVAVLALGSVWVLSESGPGRSHSSTASDASNSQEHGAALSSDAGVRTPSAQLQRCRRVYNAQLAPLLAAGTAMPQWQIHIAAMNQLVLGLISLKQATQFWSQTRVDARRHLHAFDAALARFHRRSARCLPLGPAADEPLQRCAHAVIARNHLLRAARTALRTWSGHVRHMEMLRTGMMSAAQASALWLQSWHRGQQEVNHYRSVLRAARADPAPC